MIKQKKRLHCTFWWSILKEIKGGRDREQEVINERMERGMKYMNGNACDYCKEGHELRANNK